MDLPSTHASLLLSLQREEPRPEAWRAFHARYHDVILTWCLRREFTHACAEDLTQEIWLKLLRDIRRFDAAKGRLRSWLKTVVNNTLTDCWRRKWAKPERSGIGGSAFLERLTDVVSPDAAEELSAALEAQTNNTAARVFAQVRARLHETTWQAFYLTLVEQRPAREVAEELGLSVASVYKHTYRVKQMLYKEFGHVHSDDSANHLSQGERSAAIPER